MRDGHATAVANDARDAAESASKQAAAAIQRLQEQVQHLDSQLQVGPHTARSGMHPLAFLLGCSLLCTA